jgi:hypothetical protein
MYKLKKKTNIPEKYIPKKLTTKDRKKQYAQIRKTRKNYKKKIYETREKVKSYESKKSNHILNAERIYKVKSVKPSKELARKTKCSMNALNAIMKKGQGAYYSSGSRPNQTAHSWGVARLASSITGGKAAAVDYNILEEGCSKDSKALKLARKSRKKNGYGKRKVPKYNATMKV